MEQKNKTSVGPVCTCAACGNYNPRFGNHCDALRIAFDDADKCFAKMTREERMKQERHIAANLGQVPEITKAKMKYWKEHPLE